MARSEQTHFGDREVRLATSRGWSTTCSIRVAPLRPDDGPDVGRPAPGLEGRAGHAVNPPKTKSRSRCSIWPAAPADVASAWWRPRTRHARHRLRHQCEMLSFRAANFCCNAAYDGAVTFEQGNAEELSYPERSTCDHHASAAAAAHRCAPLRSRTAGDCRLRSDRTALRHCPARR